MNTHPSFKTRDERNAYQRAYRSAGLNVSPKKMFPFVGVDGEGGNVESGYHAYFLLSAGRQSIVPTGNNIRLTTAECLDFLTSLPSNAVYVVYFGDYDVTKVLEDMDHKKLTELIDRSTRRRRQGGGVWPVKWGPYELDYLPKKEFKVRKSIKEFIDPITKKRRVVYGPWFVLNDVGSFFQCRFVEALEKWDIGTPEEREAIGIGKEARGDFRYSDIESIADYNALEIRLLSEMMEKFRAACIKTGYVPARWQGPGLLAEAMMAKHGVPKTKDIALFQDPKYDGLVTFASNAFYGGRPEISVVGPVDRPVNQRDINGAYPHAMQYVPCLKHGEWRLHETPDLPEAGSYIGIQYGSYYAQRSNDGKRVPVWYGLPHRTKEGTIIYAGNGRGWYWSFEINAAIHQTFVTESAWVYTRKCNCRPFSFLQDVHVQRKQLGKDDAGIVLKLGSNSCFGKQVQSIGSPKYGNPIYGSFITAATRTVIQQFIHSSDWCTDPDKWCGKDILMIATDSLCTWNERPDIKNSEELGGWSVEKHPRGMLIVQPGLYFGSSSKPAKTRGVPRSVIESYEPRFREAFNKMVEDRKLSSGDVSVPQRMFVGIRYALHRRNLKLLGQWIEFKDPETGRTGKLIRFDWSSKRAPYPVLDPIPGIRSYIETFPQEGDPNVETLPYSKDIGALKLRSSLRAMFEDDQPDWAQLIEPGELAHE